MKTLNDIYPILTVSTSIAVVGSSSNVIGKGYSSLIDSYTDVVRFNRAPTKGYESEIGSKSTIRISNCHVFEGIPADGRFTKEGQNKNFIRELQNQKIIIANGNTKKIWETRNTKISNTCTAYYLNTSLSTELAEVEGLSKSPSVGLISLYLLIKNKIVPGVFGFGVGEDIMTHYWEPRSNVVLHHNFSEERLLISKWHKESKILLFN
jgi:hypothetical protein